MTTARERPERVPPFDAERTSRISAAAPSVAIVVPTWNRAADAGRCLASLARLTYANRRTIVVDNGSRANERKALHAAASGARGAAAAVIELPENRGFATAVNTGVAAAFAAGCDAALVLNDDAEVDPGLLEALVAAAAADPAAGIVARRACLRAAPLSAAHVAAGARRGARAVSCERRARRGVSRDAGVLGAGRRARGAVLRVL